MSAQPVEPPVEPVVEPVDAADVQAMDTRQRRAWFATTTGPQRWQVVGRTDQPEPPPRPRYAQDAACKGADADLTELKVQGHAEGHVMEACARCPVLAWCAADARDHNAWGLWAGVVLNNGRPSLAKYVPAHDETPDAAQWLADQLAEGPRRRADLLRDGSPLGIGSKDLARAADALGIERVKGRVWALPEEDEAQEHEPVVEPVDGPVVEPVDEPVVEPVDEPSRPERRPSRQRRQPRRLTRARRKARAA